MAADQDKPKPKPRVSAIQGDEQRRVFGDLVEDGNWVGFTGGGLAQPVLLRLDRADDGRLICTGLVVGAEWGPRRGRPAREITSRALRTVKMADLLAAVRAGLKATDVGQMIVFRTIADQAQPAKGDLIRPRPGPQGHPREHFERVAATYRDVLAEGHRPLWPVLTDRLAAGIGWTNVSETTARRWVQRARDMGLLGASRPGKAGERPRKKGKRS